MVTEFWEVDFPIRPYLVFLYASFGLHPGFLIVFSVSDQCFLDHDLPYTRSNVKQFTDSMVCHILHPCYMCSKHVPSKIHV
jgi:hypothetical protein